MSSGAPVVVSDAPDVSVVVTGHREGILAHRTLRSLARASRVARSSGLRVEVIGVLDNADTQTTDTFREALAPEGTVGAEATSTHVVEVACGDPGLARMRGIQRARAAWVCVLDGDNLVSGAWLAAAHRTAVDHGAPCIVHAEQLVIFESRNALWPQLSSDDAGFRSENFYDRNYWDTFCLAARSVFEDIPYAATARRSGFGPEDWHWGMETVHAGIAHLVAPRTALFYRDKATGSVQAAHDEDRSLLPATPFLIDTSIAARAGSIRPSRRPTRGLHRRILRRQRGRDAEPSLPAPLPANVTPRGRGRRLMWPEHYRYLHPEHATSSDDELREHFESTPPQQRRGWLSDEQLLALDPDQFDVLHYRALNPDVLALPDGVALEHYLAHGMSEGRPTRLGRHQLRALTQLDLDDYRSLHEDLARHDDDQLLNHYLLHGQPEGRTGRLTAEQRQSREAVEVAGWLAAELTAVHEIDPGVPVPTPAFVERLSLIGPPRDGSITDGSRLWWEVVTALRGASPDVVLFGPWLRMGGGDILLARYANAVRRLRPDATIVVVTTHDSSTRPDWLDDGIVLIDLPAMAGWDALTRLERAQLVATIVVQYRPRTVHAFNSPEFFDAVEYFPAALSASTRIFLSTFVIDRGPGGAMANHLFHRPTDYLAVVDKVIVDNHALVERFHELLRLPRSSFAVHHQPVERPAPRAAPERAPGTPLRVMWAARFDKQKRLDVLADVAEECARAGVPVEWHVYGAPVMETAADAARDIARLKAVRATFHGTYGSFAELPLDETDLFLITSESEGIPLTLLDVLAHQVPVMASMVGGVPELVSSDTGWPIERFDDVPAYVAALRDVAARPEAARSRAAAGYALLKREFSWANYDRLLAELRGYLPD